MSVFSCRSCNYSAPTQWEGRCPGCRGLYRAKKIGTESKEQKNRSSFAKATVSTKVYIPTGVGGFDKVIGGGLVAGSTILLAGFRGSGKSSLLCLVADGVAKAKGRALYATSEESCSGIESIAHRLKLFSDDIEILGDQTNIEDVLAHVKETRPFLTVFDSLQKYTSSKSGGSAGSLSQEHAVSDAIIKHCREAKTCAIIVSQMAKSGEIKGSTDAAHAVDTVLMLGFPKADDEDAPDEKDIRVLLCDGKNRNGSEGFQSYWRITQEGMFEEVEQRSKILEFPGRGKYRRD